MHTVDASREDSVAAVLAVTGGGAQTVFHCSPVAQLLQTTLRYTNRPTGIQQVVSFRGHRGEQ